MGRLKGVADTAGSHGEGYAGRFAARLREARLAARSGSGMSQQEIAVALGLSQASISDYERGRRRPNLATLQTLARMLGVSADWLLAGEGVAAGSPDISNAGPGAGTKTGLFETPLMDLLGLSRLTYLGEAGMAPEGTGEIRAAEDRSPYLAPSLVPGRPLGISREMSAGAQYAILYTGPPRAGLCPGDVLLAGPAANGRGSSLYVISCGQSADLAQARMAVVRAEAPIDGTVARRWAVLAILRRIG